MPKNKNYAARAASEIPKARTAAAWILASAAFLFCGANARAWWDGEWTLRKQVTVDTSGTGVPISDAIPSVQVLIRLHDGDFQFGAAKPDGTDIRFVSEDDKTLLPFHIEKFDPLLDEAFVWVNVTGLKPGAKTTFWMYYGNTGNKALNVESAKDTYDADTVLVYHFNEHAQPCFDFTGNGNNAQAAGVAAEGSMIGTGLRLDGRTAVTVPGSASLTWRAGSAMTWSAWVKFGQPQPDAVLFGRRDGSNGFVIGADGGAPFVAVLSHGSISRSRAGAAMGPNSWHHLAVVANASQIELYVDGDPYADISATLPGFNGPLVVGGDGSATPGNFNGFVGEMDEMEISRVARSPGYVKFLASEQMGDSKVVSVGNDEQPTNWLSFLKKGYVGVIIGSLTPDGWAVIALLAVMSLISWLVMISKAIYLNKIAAGNHEFLKEWGHVANDLSVLEKNGGDPAKDPAKSEAPAIKIRKSAPLYRIYHMGIVEVEHRMSEDRVGKTMAPYGTKTLSARSIQAIRATLDAGLTRETHRMNDKMVLLTIAISGGPFLGLLGTVVGVMITFAAVAQAGDVNVNAIAPGIAAALAATVAGLAVAIPALFGYNYLLTRIKAASTDMHVFVDEFVTKMAEYYSKGDS
jgi:biopolymer transport protein ExbB